LEFFQEDFVFQEIRWTTFMGVHRGGKTCFCPTLGNWVEEPKMLEYLKSASRF